MRQGEQNGDGVEAKREPHIDDAEFLTMAVIAAIELRLRYGLVIIQCLLLVIATLIGLILWQIW